jgi:predicted transposase/invertase (TIGR01784 family)
MLSLRQHCKEKTSMSKFINPFTDVGFKRIFGQEISKPVLLVFLNSLLEGERKIIDLKFLDKEQLGLESGDRSLIYDIYCETETGEHIIVEMQNKYQPYFKERSIYYTARSIVEQGERGSQWKYDIKAVYLVAFLNFRISDISKGFRTDVALIDMKERTLFSDKVRLVYLQLPYFTKEADECETIFEKIIYTLKHMDILQRMPWMAQNAVFKRLSEIAEVASLNSEERRKYDESLRAYRDTIAVMEGQFAQGELKGRAEGRAEGRVEGRVEGRAEGILSIARKMKQKGKPVSEIAEMTDLSPDEIEKL